MPAPHSFRALVPVRRGRGAALSALLLLFLCACARPAPTGAPMAVSFLPATGAFLTSAGDPATPEDLITRSEAADYILMGESHGNPCDHEAERRVVQLLAHRKGGLALGLEMVPAANTAILRDFIAGNIAPEELEARLDWKNTWGHPFPRYLPVFLALREWNLPAAGLNVPHGVIRRLSAAALDPATAADPVAALAPEDRALLPARIIPPAPEQLAFLRSVMASHPQKTGVKPAETRDSPAQARQEARFLLIQSVWDTAMAEAAVRLRAETGKSVAVLAGTAHVEGGWGIARRLRELEPGARILLVSPWRGDDFDPADADLRVFCPETFESRMGMTLELRPFGGDMQAVVSRVLRGSRAEAAGLRPGDVLERAGRYPVRGLNALHLAGSDAFRDKASLTLVVLRGGARLRVDLGPLGVPGAAPAANPTVGPAAAPVAAPVNVGRP